MNDEITVSSVCGGKMFVSVCAANNWKLLAVLAEMEMTVLHVEQAKDNAGMYVYGTSMYFDPIIELPYQLFPEYLLTVDFDEDTLIDVRVSRLPVIGEGTEE